MPVGNYALYGISPQIDGMPVIHKRPKATSENATLGLQSLYLRSFCYFSIWFLLSTPRTQYGTIALY
jgi:hypothetical protein